MDVAEQLSAIFQAGLAANPDAAAGLAEALSAHDDSSGATKAEVNYRPADGNQRCGDCEHFDANRCELVAGSINPDYVCDKYDEKEEGDDNGSGKSVP